ncbi:MAG: AbrB/MazE/SpoVT family DNA-binding domain-containing protein [Candidatus Omnitrophica bacterium]|nr:AbrB/MazE/SpoVT family DNA-binding domain-containing protein [Candidatus Omnitrophota bacterium]
MTITKLKAKNQLTIPREIVKRMHLRPYELFYVDVEKNYIKLIPVEMKPRYTPEELNAIDSLVEKDKGKAKAVKPGKDFSSYIKRISN